MFFIQPNDATAIGSDVTVVASQAIRVLSDTNAAATTLTAIDSDITIIKSDTTAIDLQTTTVASDFVQMQAGHPVTKIGVNADIAGIPNNSQAAGGLCQCHGRRRPDRRRRDLQGRRRSQVRRTPISADAYGDTGSGTRWRRWRSPSRGDYCVAHSALWCGALSLPFVLESGKKLYIDGDNSAGTSAGNYQCWYLVGSE